MQVKMPRAEWSKKRLVVGTPMFGGNCSGLYTQSMMALQRHCAQLSVTLDTAFLHNESLITRARNTIADSFLKSQATHLMFIDSDIGFNPDDVITMLGLATEDSEYSVISGVYATKKIAWNNVRAAAHKDPKGLADLSRMGNEFVLRLKVQDQIFDSNKPVEVRHTGTGFMMVRRSTFEMLKAANPSAAYLADGASDGSKIHMYFQAAVDPASERYLSEDYWFCERVQDAGGKVWACPWMTLHHVGSHIFSGSISDFAIK